MRFFPKQGGCAASSNFQELIMIEDLSMTHQQRRTAIRAEVAQETMGLVIAHYSEQIALEEAKATPDAKVIELAKVEKRRVRQVRVDMDINDRDQIEVLIAEYSPMVREFF